MARIKIVCPTCGGKPKTLKEMPIGRLIMVKFFPCLHVVLKDKVKVASEDEYEAIRALNGDQLFDYQIAAVRKAEEAGLRFLCLDDMGTGKSIFAAALLRLHPEMLPALIVTKARLRIQWARVILDWGPTHNGLPAIIPHILEGSREAADPDIGVTITSYDSMWARRDKKTQEKRHHWTKNGNHGFRTIIMDEFQLIKNSAANRTAALVEFAGTLRYIIGLSGTPILNNAREFFIPLHIVRPDMFREEAGFTGEWVETYFDDFGTKRFGGIKKKRLDDWKKMIDPFTIRRTIHEVLPELPKVFRQFKYVELDKVAGKKYKQLNDEFLDAYEAYEDSSDKFSSFREVTDCMMRMRHLVGEAKVDWVVGEVEDYLDETDRKLAIYRHHDSVGNLLAVRLANACKSRGLEPPVVLDSSVNSKDAARLIAQFTDGPSRLLIARTLAEGEGLNLQACSDVLNVERQWNPGKEEQVERRFLRATGTTADRINSTYPIALGTIDEFLTKLVENKRKACQATYGNADIAWDESATTKELAEALMLAGRKAWNAA